jgi:hypothetical protein
MQIVINEKTVAEWKAALRSGEYKQGRRMLQPTENSYCCLGVLAKIQGVDKNIRLSDYGSLTGLVTAGRSDSVPICRVVESRLIAMNDNENASFKEIADYLDTLSLDEIRAK